MSIYEDAMRFKNEAIANGADAFSQRAAAQVEIAQALLALAVGNYKHARVSLISATSLVAKLADQPVTITSAKG